VANATQPTPSDKVVVKAQTGYSIDAMGAEGLEDVPVVDDRTGVEMTREQAEKLRSLARQQDVSITVTAKKEDDQ